MTIPPQGVLVGSAVETDLSLWPDYDSEIPTLELLKSRSSLDDIQRGVFKKIKNTKLARKLAIYLSRKYTG